MMKHLIKTINALFALVLLAFASLQINDPDPVIWIGFYIICALVPLLGLLGQHIKPVFWLALGLCGITLFLYAPGAYQYYLHMTQEPLMQSMNPQKPYIEEAREFLGTLITLGLIVASEWITWYYPKKNN
jgi:hypothetical protein